MLIYQIIHFCLTNAIANNVNECGNLGNDLINNEIDLLRSCLMRKPCPYMIPRLFFLRNEC